MKPLPRLEFDGGVDADGHLLEPPDLWEQYIDPKYRESALRIRKDEDGLEYVEIEGRPSKLIRKGMPAGVGAMDRVGGYVYERESTGSPYVDNAPFGGMDPTERIARLDQENLDAVILYPTLGVLWVAEAEDEAVTQANLRAYNRFIVDFCSDSKGRLVPVAQLSLGDPVAAEAELRRAVDAGCKGVWVPPFTMTRKSLGDPSHHRVFAAAQDCGVPLGVHPAFEPKWAGPGRFGEHTGFTHTWFLNVTAPDAVRHAFTTLFEYGVPELFPELKIVVLESGASWLGYWLDRMDTVFASPQGMLVRERLKQKPSAYFKRQCWISADPDETTLAAMVPLIGEDRFFWASDFPHPDHPPDYIPELTRLVKDLPESARAGFLGQNVLEAYGIER
jgi:predicted TIM-barrel fold metal-dependent hydrolase